MVRPLNAPAQPQRFGQLAEAMDQDNIPEGEWEVERFLARVYDGEQPNYLTRWTGYPDWNDHTWEPHQNVLHSPDILSALLQELENPNRPNVYRIRYTYITEFGKMRVKCPACKNNYALSTRRPGKYMVDNFKRHCVRKHCVLVSEKPPTSRIIVGETNVYSIMGPARHVDANVKTLEYFATRKEEPFHN